MEYIACEFTSAPRPVFESRNRIALDLYPTDSLHIVFENRSGLEALCNGII